MRACVCACVSQDALEFEEKKKPGVCQEDQEEPSAALLETKKGRKAEPRGTNSIMSR